MAVQQRQLNACPAALKRMQSLIELLDKLALE
jgi:hypothetical protein